MSEVTNATSSQCKNTSTGLAPLSLTRCRRCQAKKDQSESHECTLVSKEFPWAVKINCSNPNHAEWIVCTLCSVQRNGMTTREQLLRHRKKRHSPNSKKKPKKIQPKILQIKLCQVTSTMSPRTNLFMVMFLPCARTIVLKTFGLLILV